MLHRLGSRAGSVREDFILAGLLAVGVFFPCARGGEYSLTLLGVMLPVLAAGLAILALSRGTIPGSVFGITLPIIIILVACTFLTFGSAYRFAWGVFAEFSLLALIFSLNLRDIRTGSWIRVGFWITNVLWVACGLAVLLGNEWIGDFLTNWYSQFYPELLPLMLAAHKPILSFGTHSLAGFFTYIFFWLNWEKFEAEGSHWSLFFAIAELALLLGLTSFTSLGFAVVALCQIGHWLWKKRRRELLISIACLPLVGLLVGRIFVGPIAVLVDELPRAANVVSNLDNNGLLARYGAQGTLRPTLDYLWDHPFLPIGLTSPEFLFYGDSGPVQYYLRGSVPLLVLIYLGLYRFFAHNVLLKRHAVLLFWVFMAFEMAFQALPYFRTLFLLPLIVIIANQIRPRPVVMAA